MFERFFSVNPEKKVTDMVMDYFSDQLVNSHTMREVFGRAREYNDSHGKELTDNQILNIVRDIAKIAANSQILNRTTHNHEEVEWRINNEYNEIYREMMDTKHGNHSN